MRASTAASATPTTQTALVAMKPHLAEGIGEGRGGGQHPSLREAHVQVLADERQEERDAAQGQHVEALAEHHQRDGERGVAPGGGGGSGEGHVGVSAKPVRIAVSPRGGSKRRVISLG